MTIGAAECNDTVKDILNLEMVTRLHVDPDTSPSLPVCQEDAVRFQRENLTTAVFNNSHMSSPNTLTPRASPPTTTRGSRSVSRVSSNDSLCRLGTMEQVRNVTDNQKAVMSFFYTHPDKEVGCFFDFILILHSQS